MAKKSKWNDWFINASAIKLEKREYFIGFYETDEHRKKTGKILFSMSVMAETAGEAGSIAYNEFFKTDLYEQYKFRHDAAIRNSLEEMIAEAFN